MDLASRRFGSPMNLDTTSFSVKSQSAVLHFCPLMNFAKETKETFFFCQIIMLNTNVPEGRSVSFTADTPSFMIHIIQ